MMNPLFYHCLMARQFKLVLTGALYRIGSHGDGREGIYGLDTDRLMWFEVFPEACRRCNNYALPDISIKKYWMRLLRAHSGFC